jgi:hypothetical protein
LESNYSFFSQIFVLIFQLFGSWLLQPKIAAVTVVKEEEKKQKLQLQLQFSRSEQPEFLCSRSFLLSQFYSFGKLESNYSFFSPIFVLIFQLFGSSSCYSS